MTYGFFINNQLIIAKEQTEHTKPLIYTNEPQVEEGHGTVFHWEEEPDQIVQVWEVVEIPPIEPPEEIDDSEALSILTGGES